jgi:anti-anti-sigma regulatory factor
VNSNKKLRQARHHRALQRRARRKAERRKRRKQGGRQVTTFDPSSFAKAILPKHRLILTSPAELGFFDFPEQTIRFLMAIRSAAKKGKHSEIVIDHSDLVDLSAAAALTLIAELFMAQYSQPKCTLICKFPRDSAVRNLLGLIGYYKYFPAVQWTAPTGSTRFYLAHRYGEGVDQKAASELISHLRTVGRLPSSRLYEALIEGMQNATEWGYGNRVAGYRRWWLLGYRDSQTGEISYCFYDQGAGIPVTIRKRLKDRVKFLSPTGSQLIRKAVVAGHYSRTRRPTRGRGLPTLKRFVDEAASGRLLIQSRESRCVFTTGKKPKLDDFERECLQGTLITWNFTAR